VSNPEPRKYRRYMVRIAPELGGGGRMQTRETDDAGAGGVELMFPLHKAGLVRVRLCSDRVTSEPGGTAGVSGATRDPPYRIGPRFADALVERAAVFLRERLGPAPSLAREPGT